MEELDKYKKEFKDWTRMRYFNFWCDLFHTKRETKAWEGDVYGIMACDKCRHYVEINPYLD
jgi:hypothetical protein